MSENQPQPLTYSATREAGEFAMSPNELELRKELAATREALRKAQEPFDPNELRKKLRTQREVCDALALALKDVKGLLQKHNESAVLIRDGDISLASIKPHCAIRKGSQAYRSANAALAQYTALKEGK